MNVRSHSRKFGSLDRRLGAALCAAMIVAGATFGISWVQKQPCTRMDVRGLSQADSASIFRLAMPTDSFLVSALVADRIRRHPWVRSAAVACYPSGTFHVRIHERTPVLLAIDEAGHAAFFIDPAGFMMPLTMHSMFDVPLISGLRSTYHPIMPVPNPQVLALAKALTQVDSDTERLLSEFMLTPAGITAFATVQRGKTVEIRLGREDIAPRLHRLRAFWDQRVVPHPAQNFEMIDLRFEGQIVTREDPIQHKTP